MKLPIGIDNRLECIGCGRITTLRIYKHRLHNDSNGIEGVSIFIICDECKTTMKIMIGRPPGDFGIGLLVKEIISPIDYYEYIKTDKWKCISEKAKDRAGNRCQLCNQSGENGNLRTHHRTYERLGCEADTDLIVLCADCHAKFHNKLPVAL